MELRLESKFDSRIDRVESRLRKNMERLDGLAARLEHSQEKLEVLLEGLREATTRRNIARATRGVFLGVVCLFRPIPARGSRLIKLIGTFPEVLGLKHVFDYVHDKVQIGCIRLVCPMGCSVARIQSRLQGFSMDLAQESLVLQRIQPLREGAGTTNLP
ncbi:MAG: hypothetical protein OXT71_18650 [Acidobacteriota bacterium]|nr:hypothetical protein [Acidobacteriota bacterium]